MRQPVWATTPDQVMDATLGAVTTGLVPLLGRMHDGVLPLLQRSMMENDDTVMALFSQTGEPIHLTEREQASIRDFGVRIYYCPPSIQAALKTARTRVHVNLPVDDDRADEHAACVLLLAILLNQLQPTRTYIAEDDLERCAVLSRAHADLALPGEFVQCPVARAVDGLPLSAAVADHDREAARAIPAALLAMHHAVATGVDSVASVIERGRALLDAHPSIAVRYCAVVDPATLEPVTTIADGHRAVIVAHIGDVVVRDSIHLEPGSTAEVSV